MTVHPRENLRRLSDFQEDFSGDSGVKNPPASEGDVSSIPRSGRSLGVGNGTLLQYSCLWKLHGQKRLVGCSPWGCRVRHDWAHTHAHTLIPRRCDFSFLLSTIWCLPKKNPPHSSVSHPQRIQVYEDNHKADGHTSSVYCSHTDVLSIKCWHFSKLQNHPLFDKCIKSI